MWASKVGVNTHMLGLALLLMNFGERSSHSHR
jgi:hypothetical protein